MTAPTLTPTVAAVEAFTAIDTAERGFRQRQAEALPDLADTYVIAFHRVAVLVRSLGVTLSTDDEADTAAMNRAIREARDTIGADETGDRRDARQLLDSLTGVGAQRGPRWSRCSAIARAIGTARGDAVRRTGPASIGAFIADHIETGVTIGIANLAKWCGQEPDESGKRPALPDPNRKPSDDKSSDDKSSDGKSSDGKSSDGKSSDGKSSDGESSAPIGVAQAVEMVHRGMDDDALTAVVDACPVDIGALDDELRSALLAALLASEELTRRADAAAASEPSTVALPMK